MSDLDKTVNWNVLDISDYQSNTVDFEQLKNDGFKAVIIRANDAHTTMAKDPCFEMNYSMAKKAGLHVGAYWYLRGNTIDFVLKESEKFAEYCKGKSFDMPLYCDIEQSDIFALGKSFCTNALETFLQNLQNKHNMFVGIYCSTYYSETYIEKSTRDKYAFWVADWRNYCQYKGQYGIWQKGTIRTKGVNRGNSDVDFDICYVNYPSAIIARERNGCKLVELDTTPLYKNGDKDWGIYSIKEVMCMLYDHKLMKTKVDANYITYTQDLVNGANELLGIWGYKKNGIIGTNFMTKLFGYLRSEVR